MNPLLEIQVPIPFDQIRPEQVEPAIDELLRRAQAAVEEIARPQARRTFENTLLALDQATEGLEYAYHLVQHLESVVSSPELRAAHNAVEPKVTAFTSSIFLHEGLWKALQEYSVSEEARSLSPVRKRYLEKTMDAFRRHGAELDPAGKKRLEEIDVELAKLTTKFSENVLDSTNAFEEIITNEADLAGLPETARIAAEASAKAKGKQGWRFTLQAPSYIPLMTFLDNAAMRERFYRAYQTRASQGPHNNAPLVPRILELRKAKAQLLGFADFADFALVDRMAKTGRAAIEFLESLRERTLPRYHQENEELLAFRRQLEGAEAPPLAPWDVAYYAEKERAAKYHFDEEDLRPYFPVNQVLNGMFETFSKVFGITVREVPGVPCWHPDVKYYEIYDGGQKLGAFYADWFPRENKRDGAWMDAFLTGEPAVAGRHHIGVICGNLTQPAGDRPALLTHREVETVFHEFGHLLHHCLSRVEVRGFSGTNVAWDFVELPSQIMENWCWERESLDLFARHWQSGEPIPEELFQRMKRARTYRAANNQMRQLGFGILDLKLHREYDPARDGDVVAYSRAILQEFSPAPLPSEHAMILAFTHLFGNPVGYGAGYYSYKWAEVLEADAFSLFQENGVLDPETGRRFREHILAKGASQEPEALYQAFRGRPPQLNALLKRLGIADS
ncbi:MAG: M3 family metallopeptidase [Bryobacteraceae bacterium]|nr:M3 family metallopeptidase [Bryobacteraceae bacterium]MDW8380153.1 M3 family metallopeptidase [Bryobacterales bacterium]